MTFRRPVNIGDLMRLKSWVTHTWVSPHNPEQVLVVLDVPADAGWQRRRAALMGVAAWGCLLQPVARDPSLGRGMSGAELCCAMLWLQGMAQLQVEASVTQPERRSSVVTNTFHCVFSFELQRDEEGAPVPPKRVLPSTGAQPRGLGMPCT